MFFLEPDHKVLETTRAAGILSQPRLPNDSDEDKPEEPFRYRTARSLICFTRFSLPTPLVISFWSLLTRILMFYHFTFRLFFLLFFSNLLGIPLLVQVGVEVVNFGVLLEFLIVRSAGDGSHMSSVQYIGDDVLPYNIALISDKPIINYNIIRTPILTPKSKWKERRLFSWLTWRKVGWFADPWMPGDVFGEWIIIAGWLVTWLLIFANVLNHKC